MADKQVDLVKSLVKKYYLRITQECIELSPKIEDAFEVRKDVVVNLHKVLQSEERR